LKTPSFRRLARWYAWTYLALLWLSYLGVILRVDSREYSLLEYISFLVLLAIGLLALAGLRLVILTGRRHCSPWRCCCSCSFTCS
jgi:hypothetical protein